MSKKNSRKGSKYKVDRSRRARAAWRRWAKKKYGSVEKAKAAISRRFASSKAKRKPRKSEVRRLRRAEKRRFAKMSVAEKALARREARMLRRKKSSTTRVQRPAVSGFNPNYLARLRAMRADLEARAAARARANAEYV